MFVGVVGYLSGVCSPCVMCVHHVCVSGRSGLGPAAAPADGESRVDQEVLWSRDFQGAVEEPLRPAERRTPVHLRQRGEDATFVTNTLREAATFITNTDFKERVSGVKKQKLSRFS